MSLGANLIRGGIIIGLMAGVGFAVRSNTSVKSQLHNDRIELSNLKAEYRKNEKNKPTVKKVTTDYQKAMNNAKAFIAVNIQWANAGNANNQSKYLPKIKAFMLNPDSVNGGLVSGVLKTWTLKPSYGGENTNGQITMAINMYNKSGEFMGFYTYFYNVNSGKLSGLYSYMSKLGQKTISSSLTQ